MATGSLRFVRHRARRRGTEMARLAIVGAVPAGAASVYVLARCGIDVTLLEVRADFVIGCDGRS
jgi:flavin-dependent dehydrogenase